MKRRWTRALISILIATLIILIGYLALRGMAKGRWASVSDPETTTVVEEESVL